MLVVDSFCCIGACLMENRHCALCVFDVVCGGLVGLVVGGVDSVSCNYLGLKSVRSFL